MTSIVGGIMSKSRRLFVVALLVVGFALGITTSALTSEHQSQLHKSQKLLGQAKSILEALPHDYQGHRVKAIDYINQSLGELKQAIEVDAK
jgi:hypothetical protein